MSAVTQDGPALDGELLPPPWGARPLLSDAEIEIRAMAVRTAHAAGERCGREAVKHFQKCGDALIETKVRVGYRHFAHFLKATGLHPQQAQRYMLLARELPKLPAAKATRVSQLSLRDAVGELSRLSSRAAKLSAPALDRALGNARRKPLKQAMTKAANAARGLITMAPSPVPEPLPRYVELLAELLLRTVRTCAGGMPELTRADALNALARVSRSVRDESLHAPAEHDA